VFNPKIYLLKVTGHMERTLSLCLCIFVVKVCNYGLTDYILHFTGPMDGVL
jgi:hypothetical protein